MSEKNKKINENHGAVKLNDDAKKSVAGGVLVGDFEYGTDEMGFPYVKAHRTDGVSLIYPYGLNAKYKTREEAEAAIRNDDVRYDRYGFSPVSH